MKVLKVKRFKAGYEVRDERCVFGDDDSTALVQSAYTNDGHYIGSPKTARILMAKKGIKPEPATDDPTANGGRGCTCSIGFCEREQKWYGWSHRAIYGFGVGDVVKSGDCTASSGWTQEYLDMYPEKDRSLPVGFVAKALDDAKRMAVAFADSVG